MIYAYRCSVCRQQLDSSYRGDAIGPCTITPNCIGVLKRRWSVNHKPGMESHFNTTTGTVVSSMSKFRSDLSRASEDYSRRTGLDADFQPRDWGEMGATQEGMDNINRARVNAGMPALTAPTSDAPAAAPKQTAPKREVYMEAAKRILAEQEK